ncbi:MAG: cadA, partial [Massilia sp.]|nr:cadA [Massilia sp.]
MNARAVAPCFHCGLPAPARSPWRLTVNGIEQRMCCPSCLAVASSIVGQGLESFYLRRTGWSAPPPDAAPTPALPDAAVAGAEHTALLSVEAIRCAACSWLIERQLLGQAGVLQAEVNAGSALLRLRWRGSASRLDAFIASLAAIGYRAYRFDAASHAARLEAERRSLFKRLFVAGLAMMQVMMYVLPVYLASGDAADDMDGASRRLLQWAACALTAPAVLYAAQPFWRGAWRGLRAGRPGMDLPVALGIAAAFGASVVALVRGEGDSYFDAVSMFIFLLLATQYMELRARCAGAGLLRRLRQGLPPAAMRLDDYPARRTASTVAAASLRVGDHV